MKKYYGRKCWVPKKCPDCKKTTPLNLARGDFFIHGYFIGLGKRPGWGIDSWYGWCLMCAVKEIAKPASENSFFEGPYMFGEEYEIPLP